MIQAYFALTDSSIKVVYSLLPCIYAVRLLSMIKNYGYINRHSSSILFCIKALIHLWITMLKYRVRAGKMQAIPGLD